VGEPVAEPERTVAAGAAAPAETPTVTRARPRPGTGRPHGRLLASAACFPAVGLIAAAVLAATPDAARERAHPNQPRAVTRVVGKVRAGPRPNALALGGGRVWVGASGAERLAAIDPGATRRLRAIRPIVGESAADMAVSKGALWVALTRARRLVRLDPTRGRRLAAPVKLHARPTAIAAHGRDVWIGLQRANGTGEVARLDAATGEIEAAVRGVGGIVGIELAHGSLWTLHRAAPRLVRRNPRTVVPRARIRMPGTSVADLARGSGALWATVPGDDLLVRFEPRTGNLATVAVGERPAGVAVHDGSVWVAANGSSTLVRVDAASARVVGRPLRVPLNPYAVAAGPDGVWVTCVGESVVARVLQVPVDARA
jgi:streptogramin lyase